MFSIVLEMQNFNLSYKESIFICIFFPLKCWLIYFLISLEGAAFFLLEEGENIKLVESAQKYISMASANCAMMESVELRQLLVFPPKSSAVFYISRSSSELQPCSSSGSGVVCNDVVIDRESLE